MNTLRLSLYVAGLVIALALVAVITLPDFVTPALTGIFGARS